MIPNGAALRDQNPSEPSKSSSRAVTPAAPRPAAPRPAAVAPKAERPRVVVVDDLPIMRSAVCSLLEHAGMRVVAETGDEAETVAAARKLSPDVVVFDLRVTRMDAVATIRSLREADPSVQLIAHVGTGRTELAGPAGKAGATVVPTRDGTPWELLRAIDRAYRSRRKAATG
jgi:DNA-binding NarL/FixJ family response regulator